MALLGLRTVKDLALTVQVFSRFEGLSTGDFSAEGLVRHSVATGSLAKVIALAESAGRDMVADSFLAGVLHDAGKLLLAQKLPEQYEKVLTLARQKGIPHWRAEIEQFGTTHAEVGAYLLGLWSLPDPLVEAVAFHHRPEGSVLLRFAPLAAVHVANLLEHKILEPAPSDARSAVSTEFFNRLDLASRLQPWEFNCRQIGRQMTRF